MTTQCYKRHIVGCLGVREEVGYRHAQAPEKDNFHMKERINITQVLKASLISPLFVYA